MAATYFVFLFPESVLKFFCQITKGSSRFWSFNDFWHHHFVGGFAKETETVSGSSSRFFLSHFKGSLHWFIKSQKFTVCTGSDFWPNRIQFSIVHDVTVLCTLTQGKIAVKSLSYLKHFRRRFSGELQPKVHSLTRFAAWEISSISQKIRSYSFKHGVLLHVVNFFFPQINSQIEHLSNSKFLPSKFHLVSSRTLKQSQ